MKLLLFCSAAVFLPAFLSAQSLPEADRGPYARIAVLRPHDGATVDFEAGYIRHLEWHRQAKDPWVWYGWSVSIGEHARHFIYATFGHSASNLDRSVSPADDERDSIVNVTPHVEFLGSALYEFSPALSRGTGEPQPTARLELTTVELLPGTSRTFETALAAAQPSLRGETLWYRMIAGGTAPRYVRLRPRLSLAILLQESSEQALPDSVSMLIAKIDIDILNLRPTLCYGVTPARP